MRAPFGDDHILVVPHRTCRDDIRGSVYVLSLIIIKPQQPMHYPLRDYHCLYRLRILRTGTTF